MIAAGQVFQIEDMHSSGINKKRRIILVRGLGAHVWDSEGREYIDCNAGHGVAIAGHCNPSVVRAVTEQAARLITCPETFYNDRRSELLLELKAIVPEGMERFFLCNSGTEAVEAAIKFARLSTGRSGVVCAKRGFHGRTLGALSGTWEPSYRKPFEPLVPGFKHVQFGSLESLDAAVTSETAAVIVEPVQGEGGVHVAGEGYLRGLRDMCGERGALMIADEVQTGFGRTGSMFACQRFQVEPDILCMAKGLAGGVPMGAVALGPRVSALPPSVHGSTFGGNPLACAAATASIRYIRSERLPEQAARLGEYVTGRLRAIASPLVREVRGLGLMIGIELKQKTGPFLQGLMDRGILALPAGGNVIRLLPPLVISREDLDVVTTSLEEVLAHPPV